MKIIKEANYNIRDIGSMNPDIDPHPEIVVQSLIDKLNSKGIQNRGRNEREMFEDFILGEVVFKKGQETMTIPELIKELTVLDAIAQKHDVEAVYVQHRGMRFDLY